MMPNLTLLLPWGNYTIFLSLAEGMGLLYEFSFRYMYNIDGQNTLVINII